MGREEGRPPANSQLQTCEGAVSEVDPPALDSPPLDCISGHYPATHVTKGPKQTLLLDPLSWEGDQLLLLFYTTE